MARRLTSVIGLSALRTLAGRSDVTSSPQKTYLRLSLIELESARFAQEMVVVQRRLAAIQARSREMDIERAALLAGVAVPVQPPRAGVVGPVLKALEKFRHSY